ncbi:MAG: hypothetical protein RMJ56_12155 [Gemmataceae bacterium]|nr:hypothetical protein [Gemmata sp.]MDW8198345.1 hypothetical protein [Gemmataceae bacterium]
MGLRITLLMMLALLICSGCKRKRPAEDTGSDPAANPSAPQVRPAPSASLTAPEAIAALRARGAEIITSDGQPDSPVARVHMTGPKFGDDDLKLLRPFTYLHYLDLSGSRVTDNGLITLLDFEQLYMIDLSGTAITDVGAVRLAKLPHLSDLRFADTAITDKTLNAFTKQALRVFDGRRTQVTDAAKNRFRQLTGLKVYFVEDTVFKDFQSPDGTFAVSFPWYVPPPRLRQDRTPFGPITDTAYEVNHHNWSVLVAVADLNAPHQPQVEPEKLVLAGRDEIARQLKAKVSQEKKTPLDNGGLMWKFTYSFPQRPGQGPVHHRSIIDRGRIFTLMILVNFSTDPSADRERFFNSFRILK